MGAFAHTRLAFRMFTFTNISICVYVCVLTQRVINGDTDYIAACMM